MKSISSGKTKGSHPRHRKKKKKKKINKRKKYTKFLKRFKKQKKNCTRTITGRIKACYINTDY